AIAAPVAHPRAEPGKIQTCRCIAHGIGDQVRAEGRAQPVPAPLILNVLPGAGNPVRELLGATTRAGDRGKGDAPGQRAALPCKVLYEGEIVHDQAASAAPACSLLSSAPAS